MPDPLSSGRLAEIRRQVERAHTEVGEVAAQGPHRRFRMSVPSRPDRDTDLIISDALKGAEDLLAEVDRLNAHVSVLTELLNHPDRLTDHLSDLRAAFAESERDAEIDRLADGGDL